MNIQSKLPTNAISNKKDEKPPQFSFKSNRAIFREEIREFKKQNPAYFPDESYDPYVTEKDSTGFQVP